MEKPTTRDTLWTETFESTLTGGFYVEWNYRDASGELHAGVARSPGLARAFRPARSRSARPRPPLRPSEANRCPSARA